MPPAYPLSFHCRPLANGLTVPGGLRIQNRLIWRKTYPQTPVAWGVQPIRHGCQVRYGVLPRHVALQNVPACFRSVLAFGADRLRIRNVRREVQVSGLTLCSRDLPSSVELSIVKDTP